MHFAYLRMICHRYAIADIQCRLENIAQGRDLHPPRGGGFCLIKFINDKEGVSVGLNLVCIFGPLRALPEICNFLKEKCNAT